MYLYFDKKGVLKTQIDHGEKARQGSNLSVNVCLDEDFFTNLCNIYGYSNTFKNYLNWTMSVSVQGPNGSITNTEPTLESTITPFFKSFDNEVTYDLIPDTNYITYSCSIPSNQSTNYGVSLNLIFTLTAATTGYKYRLAAVKVDVEKTIGKVYTTITQNQYNQLMSAIENLAATYNRNTEVYFSQIPIKSATFILNGLPDMDSPYTPDTYKYKAEMYATELARVEWLQLANAALETNYTYSEMLDFIQTSVNYLGQNVYENSADLLKFIGILIGIPLSTGFAQGTLLAAENDAVVLIQKIETTNIMPMTQEMTAHVVSPNNLISNILEMFYNFFQAFQGSSETLSIEITDNTADLFA